MGPPNLMKLQTMVNVGELGRLEASWLAQNSVISALINAVWRGEIPKTTDIIQKTLERISVLNSQHEKEQEHETV